MRLVLVLIALLSSSVLAAPKQIICVDEESKKAIYVFDTDDFGKPNPRFTYKFIHPEHGPFSDVDSTYSVSPEVISFVAQPAYPQYPHKISRKTLKTLNMGDPATQCSIADVDTSDNLF
jgi:hypothetical protein